MDNSYTWMIVEDDAATLDALIAMFQLWGYAMLPFNCGRAALDYLQNDREIDLIPEVALIDIRLPDIGGPQISAAIRKHSELQDIAVMLMTAYRLDAVERARVMDESGADEFVYKPLPAMDQLIALGHTIRQRRAEMRAAVAAGADRK